MTISPANLKRALRHRYFVFPIDIFLILFSYYLAGVLRFDSFDPVTWETYFGFEPFVTVLALLVVCKSITFIVMGFYKSLWTYASLYDIFQILKTTALSSLFFVVLLLFYNRLVGISRSVLFLDGVLTFLFLSFRSFSWRIFRDLNLSARNGKKTLIIGAGAAGNRLATELRANRNFGLLPVGFLDDDPRKRHGKIQGIPVVGTIAEIEECLADHSIDEVIIATRLNPDTIRSVYRTCESAGVQCKTLPPIETILNKNDLGRSLRDINIEDLLGRAAVNLETEEVSHILYGKNILITGAGGSIGSEVCRQLTRCRTKSLVLFDQAETPLYEIEYELRHKNKTADTAIVPVVGDIRDREFVETVMRKHKIDVVFHCAAYKHVPMMELNIAEAILNNVQGTIHVANAARDVGVERFVMISTDKAVNPVNIMGATKRVAELYIQNLARTTKTKYITVRFGNVLGSNGSVIPLFQKQIENGGPVTITHPEIIRYFMTIPEASGLVIQAGAMGDEGEIFILDMGKPVKIKDLAEDLIRLSGFIPGKEIEITYVGLRPGEKLFEELLLAGEGIQPTRHEKIFIAKSAELPLEVLEKQIEHLIASARDADRKTIDALLTDIVPEYKPAGILPAT